MGNLTFCYDPVGDILTIQLCSSYAEQEMEELADEVLARVNPESGNIEMLEILFFSKRVAQQPLSLPILALLQPAATASS